MPTLPQSLKQLKYLITQGHLKIARKGLDSLKKQVPNLREIYELQLCLDRREKSYSMSETTLQTLIGPTAPKLPRYITSCYRLREENNFSEALNVAKIALKEHAEIPEAHANYLELLLEIKEDSAFIQALIQASAFLNEELFETYLSEVMGQFVTRLLCDEIEDDQLGLISDIFMRETSEKDDVFASLKSLYCIVSEKKQNKRELICIEVTKFGGEITHYNHFFGAVALPLLEMLEMTTLPANATFILPFCGPMTEEVKEILRSFNSEVVFIPEKMSDYLANASELFGHSSKITLPSYDVYWNFGQRAPSSAIDEARRALQRVALQQGLSLERSEKCAITFVDRDSKMNSFYIENNHTSGALRRSIPNSGELVTCLREIENTSVKKVKFEGMSLIEKFALMQTTDIFIVQHGAALTATYWLPPGATVIEILAKDLGLETLGPGNGPAPHGSVRPAGQILAEQMRANYFQLVQDASHAPVNVKALQRLCKKLSSRVSVASAP